MHGKIWTVNFHRKWIKFLRESSTDSRQCDIRRKSQFQISVIESDNWQEKTSKFTCFLEIPSTLSVTQLNPQRSKPYESTKQQKYQWKQNKCYLLLWNSRKKTRFNTKTSINVNTELNKQTNNILKDFVVWKLIKTRTKTCANRPESRLMKIFFFDRWAGPFK